MMKKTSSRSFIGRKAKLRHLSGRQSNEERVTKGARQGASSAHIAKGRGKEACIGQVDSRIALLERQVALLRADIHSTAAVLSHSEEQRKKLEVENLQLCRVIDEERKKHSITLHSLRNIGEAQRDAALEQLQAFHERELRDLQILSTSKLDSFASFEPIAVGVNGGVFSVQCCNPYFSDPNAKFALKCIFNYQITGATAIYKEFSHELTILARLPRNRHVLKLLAYFIERPKAEILPYLPEAVRIQRRQTMFILTELHPKSAEQARDDLGHEGLQWEEKNNFTVTRWALGILKGVNHLYKHHIVHRDLKLDNILISEENEAVIIDFGLAMDLAPRPRIDPFLWFYVDDSRWKGGNLNHLAPEIQAVEYPGPDVVLDFTAADAWAVGVMIFELITFRHPFESFDGDFRYITDADRELIDYPVWASEALRTVVEGLLLVDPWQRMTLDQAISILERSFYPST